MCKSYHRHILAQLILLFAKDLMFSRFANYRLRMQGLRQKYFTVMKKTVHFERKKALQQMRRRMFRGVIYTIILGTGYYYGNQFFSQHHEKKEMKRQLLKEYPSQTYLISFTEDPSEALDQIQKKKSQEQFKLKADLVHPGCVYVQEETPECLKVRQKLGDTIIITSPTNMNQLCNVIEKCHKYRHKAIVGSYPIPPPQWQRSVLFEKLNNIPKPINKQKYVVVDMSRLRSIKINKINDVLEVDTGFTCREVNEILVENGYKQLFEEYSSEASVHNVIVQNLPLAGSQSLQSKIINLSLVSADGKRFKSATQVQSFGQVLNLTSLFLGTGGAYAIPASLKINIQPKSERQLPAFEYKVSSQNESQLIIKLRQIRSTLSKSKQKYSIFCDSSKSFILRVHQQLQNPIVSQYVQKIQNSPKSQIKDTQYILSINNQILEKILLKGSEYNLDLSQNSSFKFQNGLLYLQGTNVEGISKNYSTFLTYASSLGGVLVWSRDRQLLNSIKPSIDLTETGAELMKKIVEVREGIDKRQILQSHQRYEQYFAKGMFRKATQFFW